MSGKKCYMLLVLHLQRGSDDPCPRHTFYRIDSDVPLAALASNKKHKKYNSQGHLLRQLESFPMIFLQVLQET